MASKIKDAYEKLLKLIEFSCGKIKTFEARKVRNSHKCNQ